MKYPTNTSIIVAASKATGIDRKTVRAAFLACLHHIRTELCGGRTVALYEFGRFTTYHRKGRTIKANGVTIVHPDARYVRFRSSNILKNQIKLTTNEPAN